MAGECHLQSSPVILVKLQTYVAYLTFCDNSRFPQILNSPKRNHGYGLVGDFQMGPLRGCLILEGWD